MITAGQTFGRSAIVPHVFNRPAYPATFNRYAPLTASVPTTDRFQPSSQPQVKFGILPALLAGKAAQKAGRPLLVALLALGGGGFALNQVGLLDDAGRLAWAAAKVGFEYVGGVAWDVTKAAVREGAFKTGDGLIVISKLGSTGDVETITINGMEVRGNIEESVTVPGAFGGYVDLAELSPNEASGKYVESKFLRFIQNVPLNQRVYLDPEKESALNTIFGPDDEIRLAEQFDSLAGPDADLTNEEVRDRIYAGNKDHLKEMGHEYDSSVKRLSLEPNNLGGLLIASGEDNGPMLAILSNFDPENKHLVFTLNPVPMELIELAKATNPNVTSVSDALATETVKQWARTEIAELIQVNTAGASAEATAE